MKKSAFTICARNYLGLSFILEKSLKKYNQDVEFYIFIADEFLEDEIHNFPDNVIISRTKLNIPQQTWHNLSFKYDLTEFCTCLKPFCFDFIFRTFRPDTCLYFDPDILIYSSLSEIFENFNNHSIIITPHITEIQEIYSGNLNENNLLFSGLYNLGFLGLKNDSISQKMLRWWKNRLMDGCYNSQMENYFTDQKWIDFLPSFFKSELLISFNLGFNLAPWNYHERKVEQSENGPVISNRNQTSTVKFPLIFAHFSGFDYKKLINDEILNNNLPNLKYTNDIKELIDNYSIELKNSTFLNYINYKYKYNYYSNGYKISFIHRRLFRRLITDFGMKGNPFDVSSELYLLLIKNKIIHKKHYIQDKVTINNIASINSKLKVINSIMYLLFLIFGPNKFFQFTKLLRLYSKPENHIYLFGSKYNKHFKLWH